MKTVVIYIVVAALGLGSCAKGPIRHDLTVRIEKSVRFTVANRSLSTSDQPVYASSISTQGNYYRFRLNVDGKYETYELETQGNELPVNPGDTLMLRYVPSHDGERSALVLFPDGMRKELDSLDPTVSWIVPDGMADRAEIKATSSWTADGRDGLETLYDASASVILLTIPR